jgi:hypothetical protein
VTKERSCRDGVSFLGILVRSGERLKRLKKIPTFKDEEAEREFWSTADSTEYVDWSKAQKLVLPNFRPTLRTISLRLPESMIAELKTARQSA